MSNLTVTEAKAIRKALEDRLNLALELAQQEWKEATGTALEVKLDACVFCTALGARIVRPRIVLHAML